MKFFFKRKKKESSCFIAYKSRAFGPSIYWGPFNSIEEINEWSINNDMSVSVFELKNPSSDKITWWD